MGLLSTNHVIRDAASTDLLGLLSLGMNADELEKSIADSELNESYRQMARKYLERVRREEARPQRVSMSVSSDPMVASSPAVEKSATPPAPNGVALPKALWGIGGIFLLALCGLAICAIRRHAG